MLNTCFLLQCDKEFFYFNNFNDSIWSLCPLLAYWSTMKNVNFTKAQGGIKMFTLSPFNYSAHFDTCWGFIHLIILFPKTFTVVGYTLLEQCCLCFSGLNTLRQFVICRATHTVLIMIMLLWGSSVKHHIKFFQFGLSTQPRQTLNMRNLIWLKYPLQLKLKLKVCASITPRLIYLKRTVVLYRGRITNCICVSGMGTLWVKITVSLIGTKPGIGRTVLVPKPLP